MTDKPKAVPKPKASAKKKKPKTTVVTLLSASSDPLPLRVGRSSLSIRVGETVSLLDEFFDALKNSNATYKEVKE